MIARGWNRFKSSRGWQLFAAVAAIWSATNVALADPSFNRSAYGIISSFLPLSGGTLTGALLLSNGTVGAPSIAFSSDADGTGTGFYRPSTNAIAAANNGVLTCGFISSGIGCSGGSTGISWTADSTITNTQEGFMYHQTTGNIIPATAFGGSPTIGKFNFGTYVRVRTTGETILDDYSYGFYSNEGAGARVDLTLPTAPAASLGYCYTFLVQSANGIKVIASAGDTIRNAATVSAAAGYICDAATAGNSITLCSINATEWFTTSIVGTWTIDSGCP